MTGNKCTVSEATLRNAPFFLAYQSPVTCQVVTYTTKCGSSARYGSGAVLPGNFVIPDMPYITSVSGSCGQIVVQCNPGSFNGGSNIFAYTFFYRIAGSSASDVFEETLILVNNNALSRQFVIDDIIDG